MTQQIPSPFLRLARIGKSFGRTRVLRDIDLDIADGEFICFLGPSGCGKSTLLRIIAGLAQQSEGVLLKQGKDISRQPAAARDTGILFQSYALFPNLSVSDNVGYGLVNRGVKRSEIAQRVTELLVLVGLPGIEEKLPGQLSGGQQQRVALARALAPSPSILLLDEPLSALDAKVRLHLRQQIKVLHKQFGLTTIMVTHDQEEALTMADRIVVMNHGLIEQIGTPTEIYRHPATRFVADFMGKMNFLDGRVGSRYEVHVGGARFVTDAACSLPSSGPVTLCFRPEDLCVRQVGAETSNAFDATVRELEFLGTTYRATLQVPQLGELPILADFSGNDARELGVAVGRRVRIAIEAQHLRVFPAPAEVHA